MIQQVEVENWKAHDKFKLDLAPGINFIMGPNGQGKTSLLEAMTFALIGETTIVENAQTFVRIPQRATKVSLTFGNNGTRYMVERTIDENQRATTRLREVAGKNLASTAKAATEFITKFLGTNSDFFKRVVYMPEGEVFRFINRPPGKAVMGQIEDLLGINQMKVLGGAAKQVLKDVKSKEKVYRELIERYDATASIISEKRARPLEPFTALEQMQNEQELLATRLASIGERRATARARIAELDQLAKDITVYEDLLSRFNIPTDADPLQFITALAQTNDQAVESLRTQLETITSERGRLQGQSDAHQDVLRLLQADVVLENQYAMMPCPVCGKPLNHDERGTIMSVQNARLKQISQELADLQSQANSVQTHLKRAQSELTATRQAITQLQQLLVRLAAVSNRKTLVSEVSALKKDDADLNDEQKQITQRLKELQEQSAAIAALRSEMNSLGFASVDDLRKRGLVECYRGMILIDAMELAIEATLQHQLDMGLQDVYKEIALVWKQFVSRHSGNASDWEIRFDQQGIPSLTNVEGQRVFDVQQLSGGEKTALLVMIHTILARHFSRADFLMIDEPLEHLDPINRRSLIRYLVESYRQGHFSQMIITTFEESLIRKYLADEWVHVIHLDSPLIA